jgi:pimeloyl-ACP methyl ester carboxylesterase
MDADTATAAGPLRTLGWWAADYAYAVVWQVRGLFDRAAPQDFGSGPLTPVVVIPGIWESWKFLQPLITAMHDRGHPVHVVTGLRFNNRPVVDAAAQVAAYLDAVGLTDTVVVAHSKGGLIGKYLMVGGSSAARIRGMVAVAAPFSGSLYARYLFVPSLRIFSPKDALVLSLAKEQSVNSRIVSVFGRFDPHIPGGSELVGAKNVRLDTGGHFRVLAHPRVMAEVALLAEG